MIRETLFPTHAYTLNDAIMKKDNAMIKKDIMQKLKKTNRPSWQSESNLHLKQKYKSLCDQIIKMATKIFEEQDIQYERFEITSMWANVLKTNENFHAHTHANNYLSGVYYVQTKNTHINFLDPRPQSNVIRPAVKNYNILNSSVLLLTANENKLILFPSWLQHYVSSNKDKEPRISVSFNIMFKGILSTLQAKEYNEF
tara:strand:- start:356 stop:952 length:597 start_codon:yes stop_codon:yes gene_type:complete